MWNLRGDVCVMQGVPGPLDAIIALPGGYSTTRRDALKVVALGGGLGSLYVLLTRTKVSLMPQAKAVHVELQEHHKIVLPRGGV